MSKQSEREAFLVAMSKEGVPLDVARLVLRHAATLQRLAEAQCNGDWPADNGERPTLVCACGSAWAPGAYLKHGPYQVACWRSECGWEGPATPLYRAAKEQLGTHTHEDRPTTQVRTMARCPDCRAADRIKALLAPYNVVPDFSGDPRGAVVKLVVPSGRTDDWGETGLCVPA